MNITILLFPGITALDAIGPYEVLARLPDARVTFVGKARGEIRSDNGALGLLADAALDDVTATDLLLVPGGRGARALLNDQAVLAWVRALDAHTRITASVCTGALVLAAAGLLRGRRANTHFSARDRLAHYGALPTPERVVRDGKYATAAGVSAGIDLALALAIELHGPELAARIQLAIEYDPHPPLDAGNAETAPTARREPILAAARRFDAEYGLPPVPAR